MPKYFGDRELTKRERWMVGFYYTCARIIWGISNIADFVIELLEKLGFRKKKMTYLEKTIENELKLRGLH